MRRIAPADHMAIAKPSRLAFNHVADAASLDGLLDVASPEPPSGEERSTALPPVLAGRGDGVLGARADLMAARNQERFSRHR